MGLDMCVYKIRKLDVSEAAQLQGKNISSLNKDSRSFVVISKEEALDENGNLIPMFAQLSPYLREVKLIDTFFNLNQVQKDFGIPEDAEVSGLSCIGNVLTYCFQWKQGEKRVELSREECEKYTYEDAVEFYICGCTKLAYWRKEYRLQNKLYDLCPVDLENCGYYRCTDEMLAAMQEFEAFEDGIPECDSNEAIFYWEWY